MMADSRDSLFGGAAKRNAGKVNPYANVGAPEQEHENQPATASNAASSSSAAPPGRSPGKGASANNVADDDASRGMLLAGGKKRPDPSPDVAAGAGADNANNDEMPPAEGAMFEGDLDFDFADLNMTAGASAANGRGVGDGEDGGLDFAAIDADLERFEKDDMVREALQRGVDLRLYSKQVDHELRQLEMLSIADYIKESDHIASLFDQINGCETVLTQMQGLLQGFQENLGGISDEIRSLQEESLGLSVKMQNRKNVGAKIKTFLAKVAVPETLIDRILEGEINEAWLRDLRSLSEKLEFLNGSFRTKNTATAAAAAAGVAPAASDDSGTGAFTDSLQDLRVNPFDTPAANQSVPVVRNLQAKAVLRVRDFLARAIGEVCKPKTNMQKQQEYVLLKYAYAMAFLTEHGVDRERGSDAGREIRGLYTREVGGWYADIFRRYTEDLAKSVLPYANKNDVLGNFDPTQPGSYQQALTLSSAQQHQQQGGGGQASVPPEPYSVSDRVLLLQDMATCSVLQPHVVQAERQRLPFESIFRSVVRHLSDVALAEEVFCRRFFGEAYGREVHAQCMGKAIGSCLAALDDHLAQSWDAPGLLLLVAMLSQQWNAIAQRGSSCLDGFCIRAVEAIRKRFRMVFDANLASVRAAQAAPKAKLGAIEAGPGAHAVTRRFADWCGSILVLHRGITHPSAVDQMLGSHITTITKEMETLWSKMAAEVAGASASKGPLPRAAFTLNQYAHVHAVYAERGVAQEDSTAVTDGYNKALPQYVDDAVDNHFRVFTGWVKKTEAAAQAAHAKSLPAGTKPGTWPVTGPNGQLMYLPEGFSVTAEQAECEAIVRDFALNWRSGLAALNEDVGRYFGRDASSKVAMAVLMAVFSKVAELHNRFTSIIAKAFPGNPSFTRDIVGLQTVYAEMRRYGRQQG